MAYGLPFGLDVGLGVKWASMFNARYVVFVSPTFIAEPQHAALHYM